MMRLAIMMGGAAGAVARHGISTMAAGCCASTVPWATLLVNVSGSWALGLLMSVLPAANVTPAVRAGLTIGFCGGFTTFSTFSLEALTLARTGHVPLAVAYIAASVVLAMFGVVTGMATGPWLMRRAARHGHAPSPEAYESPKPHASPHRPQPTKERR